MVMTDELFEQYKNIVYYCYNKLEKTKFVIDNQEDIIQEGFLALINAINNYEEYRTVVLSSYIFHCVKYRMWGYINKYNKPYSWIDEDISELDYMHLYTVDTQEKTIEEVVDTLLKDYRYYLSNYTKNKVNTDMWIDRAQVILKEYIKNDKKIPTRQLEEEFCITRTTVSKILKDLRKVITMKNNNKLYKEGANL